MSDLTDLELIVNSRTPLITVESREETRIVELFQRIAKRRGLALYRWVVSEGLRRLDGDHPVQRSYREPAEALTYMHSLGIAGIFLLLDFEPYLKTPLNVRLIREIAQTYHQVPKTVVLISPELRLPNSLSHHAARFELTLPDEAMLKEMIIDEARGWTRQNPGKKVQARSGAIEALTRNLAGLTLADARRLARNAIYDDGVIDDGDLNDLSQAKYRLLDGGGVLSFEYDTVKPSEVAGLHYLKKWLEQRREIFLSPEPPPGFDMPKGLLLLGVQGGGKSLAAKSVAGAWGIPLLRLDFATLYNKYYGETERNLRESLKAAGTMAPCVLWIDEIEKGLANDAEGGPSRRILGTLLTWMAERKERVFMVATANDIESLPPELLRKGRFDEIFFVDLPTPEVRLAIFKIHLGKRGQDESRFDLNELVTLSEGFTGAEIEQTVVSSLYSARAATKALDTELLRQEIERTKPLSILMAEKIAYLRAWAADRTVSAE